MSVRLEGAKTLKFAEKFNIVNNDHGRTYKCDFSVSDWKFLFWANLVKKIKIVGLSWNLVSRLIRICRIQWGCQFFYFRPETHFLSKFGPKNQNCQLSWNLVPRLIRICKIQWCCSLFLFYIGSLIRQTAVFNTAFLFCWGEFALELFLGTALKILNNIKLKQTFYFTWINFSLKNLSCQILIELFM